MKRFCNICGVELVVGVNCYARQARCKACHIAKQAEHNANRHDEYLAYQREYYAGRSEDQRQRHTEYMKVYNATQWRENEEYRRVHLLASANSGHARRVKVRTDVATEKIDRRAVWGRDEGHCRIKLVCDGVFVPFEEMHMDHIIPLSKGGTHTWPNVQTGCASCNLAKGSRILEAVI